MSTQPPYFEAIRRALSDPRLDAYRTRPAEGELDVLGRYMWSMAVGEALYPVLQCLEVALRNTLRRTIAGRYGERWFDDPNVLVDARAQSRVSEAKQDLARRGKPIEPDRVVAALDFGFWTSLLNVAYEQGPTRPPAQRPLWPSLLPVAFPHGRGTIRGRYTVSGRFNAVRDLRNRVFHHEPIWRGRVADGRRADLPTQHAEILEALGWISPELRDTVIVVDRFPEVARQGTAHYRGLLEAFCRERGNAM